MFSFLFPLNFKGAVSPLPLWENRHEEKEKKIQL